MLTIEFVGSLVVAAPEPRLGEHLPDVHAVLVEPARAERSVRIVPVHRPLLDQQSVDALVGGAVAGGKAVETVGEEERVRDRVGRTVALGDPRHELFHVACEAGLRGTASTSPRGHRTRTTARPSPRRPGCPSPCQGWHGRPPAARAESCTAGRWGGRCTAAPGSRPPRRRPRRVSAPDARSRPAGGPVGPAACTTPSPRYQPASLPCAHQGDRLQEINAAQPVLEAAVQAAEHGTCPRVTP